MYNQSIKILKFLPKLQTEGLVAFRLPQYLIKYSRQLKLPRPSLKFKAANDKLKRVENNIYEKSY